MNSSKTNKKKKRNRRSPSSSADDYENEIDLSLIPPPPDSSSSSSDDDDNDTSSSSFSEAKRTPIPLPRTVKGVLVQHRLRHNACQELKEMGVEIDDDFFSFTQEEDDIIRKNWEEYAKFLKFNGTLFEFLGFDEDGLTSKNPNFVSVVEFNSKLWPTLCKGLNNRFAKLVRSRISYIFHPDYRENEDYELAQAARRVKNGEPLPEVCRSLKIPPQYMKRHQADISNKKKLRANRTGELLDGTQLIVVLRLLHETLLDNGETEFSLLNFDIRLFRTKCLENSIDPPPCQDILSNTYRRVFARAEQCIFSHLTPAPTLRNKIMYMHEAYTRYVVKPGKRVRKTEKPVLHLSTLFTVVFEDYNKSEEWNPPAELIKYASHLDLEKIRERLDRVKETRKRLSLTPKTKYNVVVTKRKRLEDTVLMIKSRRRMAEVEATPPRDVDSSPSPPVSVSEDQPGELEEEFEQDPVTELEISTINTNVTNTSSSFLNRNETILAAGGDGVERPEDGGFDDTSLGTINNQSIKKTKADDTVELDLSQDIWSQLVAG